MDRPRLSPRLRAIADRVPPSCRRLADIGTDHGYLPADLLLTGRLDFAVAADIGAEPLDRARRTAEKFAVANMDLRLGDGLSVLAPGEVDCVVIAGMGGDTVIDILAAAPWTREGTVLLLQPMTRAELLRPWLAENGYAIRAEALAADRGVIYPILTVTGGEMPPVSPAQAWGGVALAEDPMWGPYLTEHILRLRKAVRGLERARDPSLADKRLRLSQAAAQLETWKEAWQRDHGT